MEFNTVLQNKVDSGFLTSGKDKQYKLVLTRVVSPNTTTEDMSYKSYLAEILSYSIPTGRRDLDSIPGNLSYRNSEDERISLEDGLNEPDETWAETMLLKERLGADKNTILNIAIISISAICIIGVSVILIKKYVVKKV